MKLGRYPLRKLMSRRNAWTLMELPLSMEWILRKKSSILRIRSLRAINSLRRQALRACSLCQALMVCRTPITLQLSLLLRNSKTKAHRPLRMVRLLEWKALRKRTLLMHRSLRFLILVYRATRRMGRPLTIRRYRRNTLSNLHPTRSILSYRSKLALHIVILILR